MREAAVRDEDQWKPVFFNKWGCTQDGAYMAYAISEDPVTHRAGMYAVDDIIFIEGDMTGEGFLDRLKWTPLYPCRKPWTTRNVERWGVVYLY